MGSTSGSLNPSKYSTTALNTSLSKPGYFGNDVLMLPCSMLGPSDKIQEYLNKSFLVLDCHKYCHLQLTKHFIAANSHGGTISLARMRRNKSIDQLLIHSKKNCKTIFETNQIIHYRRKQYSYLYIFFAHSCFL